MIKRTEFSRYIKTITNWVQNYFENIEKYPVKSQVKPGDIYNQLPDSAPEESESINQIIEDLDRVIMPGITHWQHPNFHAYFPANSSVESLYAELITASLGTQCMIWETSPAAAELEQRVLEWMRDAMGLPKNFEGVIQDTASSATLVALLTARERATNFQSNVEGVPNNLRIYCSSEAHSSIDKAVGISGIGKKNLIKIEVDEQLRMIPSKLEEQIQNDLREGYRPTFVLAAIGTTGT
ncbi:MAG: pyridoxal-dependent decarboxylase, partial [Cyclobacteriaceae bacterium]|nr:pyridoxal-dependent decarboxylase [Cyclobacteriaceae bacterium]